MNIEINTDFLTGYSLSADDYMYLYIIQRNGYEYLQTLNLNPNIDTMLTNGYLELSGNKYVITDAFKLLVTSNYDLMFAELIDTYPMKVRSEKGQIRILHAKDAKAKSNAKAKKWYKKITKTNKSTHEHIIKCLNTQLEVTKDNLGYMQNLETWLNNHTWEKYEEINYDNKSESESQRITRQL
tara:strand:- start:4310 stop:4858 length:549 start_codon:yes stop_codon:yes gene_type:complete